MPALVAAQGLAALVLLGASVAAEPATARQAAQLTAAPSFENYCDNFSKGRINIGLGSQVKGHNVRRFGVPWSAPAPRMAEYIEALRAIWRCWERGEPPLSQNGKRSWPNTKRRIPQPQPSGAGEPR